MNEDKGISRRGFLKAAAAVGAVFAIEPTLNKVQAAERIITGSSVAKNTDMPYRTLGSGSVAMEVSALGLGVMGMTYNRSQYPSKELRRRVIAEAVERGVNLFDTGIIYGPLTNEIFAGEALAPYKNRVNITTKFGHEVIDGKATGRQNSRPKVVRQYCEDSLRRLGIDGRNNDISRIKLAECCFTLMDDEDISNSLFRPLTAENINLTDILLPKDDNKVYWHKLMSSAPSI